MHRITHCLIPLLCSVPFRLHLFRFFYWFPICINPTSTARTSSFLRLNFYFLHRVIHQFSFLNNLFLSCQRVPVPTNQARILLIIYRFRIPICGNSAALRLLSITSSIIMDSLVYWFTRIMHISQIFSWNWSSLLIKITITLYIIHEQFLSRSIGL